MAQRLQGKTALVTGGGRGIGQASYGPREQGRYAAEFYTTVKTVYVNA